MKKIFTFFFIFMFSVCGSTGLNAELYVSEGDAVVTTPESEEDAAGVGIYYLPGRSGIVSFKIFDSKGNAVATHIESIDLKSSEKETSTMYIYIDLSHVKKHDHLSAVLSGGGFFNKVINFSL